MRLATPDPGTHWEFDRGDDLLLTGPIPTFNLIDDTTGRNLGQVFLNLSLTQLGIWFDSWLTIRAARRGKRIEQMLDRTEAAHRTTDEP